MSFPLSPVGPRRGRRRDLRGRGRRGPQVLPGPLSPHGVPAMSSRRAQFDELVLSVVHDLEERWRDELGLVEFAVEETPWMPDDWSSGTVPLASLVRGSGDKPTRLTVQAFRDAGGDAGTFSFQHGADDAQNVTTSRLAPVVVRHVGDADLDRIVERITRVCQDNDEAVAHALVHAHVLRRLLNGEALEAALEAVIGGADGPVPESLATRYADAKAMRGVSVLDATGALLVRYCGGTRA